MVDPVVQKCSANREMTMLYFLSDNCHLQKYTLQISVEFPQNEKLMSYRSARMIFLKSKFKKDLLRV